MRRLFLISWLAIVGVTVCGGVWAARKAECPAAYKQALVQDLASLPPLPDWPLTAGRVVAVNEKDGTITVHHKAIPRYELDAMTRVFAVQDKEQLAGLGKGDKIRFGLVHKDHRYLIDRLEHSN